jgi:uncharacterized protein YkwD
VKLTRLARLAACTLAAGCAAAAPDRGASALSIRAPDLRQPLGELYPAPGPRPADEVKAGLLDRINEDRAKSGLKPVAWDEAASRLADAYCAAQVAEGTRGHFLTNGTPPYARTALAGIFGMGAENSVSWVTTAESFEESALELALAGHEGMMSETPPDDGHRRTILDPGATHVGVGYALEHGSFRMAEEFLTRHLAELTLEQVADRPDTVLFRGRTRAEQRLAFVTIAQEPLPQRLSKAEANRRSSYALPAPRIAYVPEGMKSMRVVGSETEDRILLGPTSDFSFRFTPLQPGLWTIVFYTSSDRGKPRPGGLAVLEIARAAR